MLQVLHRGGSILLPAPHHNHCASGQRDPEPTLGSASQIRFARRRHLQGQAETAKSWQPQHLTSEHWKMCLAAAVPMGRGRMWAVWLGNRGTHPEMGPSQAWGQGRWHRRTAALPCRLFHPVSFCARKNRGCHTKLMLLVPCEGLANAAQEGAEKT